MKSFFLLLLLSTSIAVPTFGQYESPSNLNNKEEISRSLNDFLNGKTKLPVVKQEKPQEKYIPVIPSAKNDAFIPPIIPEIKIPKKKDVTEPQEIIEENLPPIALDEIDIPKLDSITENKIKEQEVTKESAEKKLPPVKKVAPKNIFTETPNLKISEDKDKLEEIAQEIKTITNMPRKKPVSKYKKSFSSEVFKRKYSNENKHLPNVVYDHDYVRILFENIYNNRSDVIERVIKKFSNPNITDTNGNTPLIYSTMLQRVNLVLYLISIDSNLNYQNNFGFTALHAAALNNNEQLVEILLSKGALPDLKDKTGATAFILALIHGNAEVVQKFISLGYQTDYVASNGDSVLHLAIRQKNNKLFDLLYQDSLKNNLNKENQTPLIVAAMHGNDYAVKKLLLFGVNIHRKDKSGRDAAMIASDYGFMDIAARIESLKIKQEYK